MVWASKMISWKVNSMESGDKKRKLGPKGRGNVAMEAAIYEKCIGRILES